MTASSCDEYVWALLSAAQTRGVRLTPALLPQKHKIVIYSHSEPETIVLNGDGSGSGAGAGGEHDDPAEEGRNSEGGGGGSGASSNSSGPASSTSPDSWSSSSLSSSAHKAANGEGGDQAGEEQDGGGGGGSTNSTASSSVSSGQEERQGDEEEPDGDERRRRLRQRGRTLLWGSSLRGSLDEAKATPAPGTASALSSSEHIVSVEPASDASDSGGGGSAEGAREIEDAGVDGVVTLQPTASSTEASVAEGRLGETPAPVAVLDDWEQVVAYYQSLQLCLQEVSY